MAVKKILRIGDPFLLKTATPVDPRDIRSREIQQIIQNMQETMNAANGAGLAAPQIGIGRRIVIFGFEHNPRYPDREPIAETILINPEIIPLDGEIAEDWEGCLSVPKMRGLVPRPVRIRYRGYDQMARTLQRDVDGFHARVVQHECDHLDGILYPQRIRDMRQFGYEEELFAGRGTQAAG